MEQKQLKQIYGIMLDNGYDEIEVSLKDDERVKMVRDSSPVAISVIDDSVLQPEIQDDEGFNVNQQVIASENVGIFGFLDDDEIYQPHVGDRVEKGEKLGKINLLDGDVIIKSSFNGVISKINVKHNELVDYGRTLLVIDIEN